MRNKIAASLSKSIALCAIGVISTSSFAADEYSIEVAHNDEIFIINDEKYEAQTYCFNMQEGDRVIFLEGNALGACAYAKVLNLRTKDVCNLWCE